MGASGYVSHREARMFVWVDDLIATVTIYPESDIDEARAAAAYPAQERGRPGQTVDTTAYGG